MTRAATGALLMMSALAAGCGGGGSGSCTASANGMKVTCAEFSGVPESAVPQEKQDCAMQNGVFSSGGCDRAGALGGCRVTFSGQGLTLQTTTWYYPSASIQTSADVMKLCAQIMGVNAMYVSP